MVQSQAQQAQEDAVLAGQVRSEMWGNLQGILNMLTSQGCSHQVRDMVHQIAVHFANEQSHSVAVDRRLRNSLTKEKDARRRMQQQLQGCVQVSILFQQPALHALQLCIHLASCSCGFCLLPPGSLLTCPVLTCLHQCCFDVFHGICDTCFFSKP